MWLQVLGLQPGTRCCACLLRKVRAQHNQLPILRRVPAGGGMSESACQAGSRAIVLLARPTAAVMAARACGLFFQQVDPTAAEACARMSLTLESPRSARDSMPICSSRAITVGPTPLSASNRTLSSGENGIHKILFCVLGVGMSWANGDGVATTLAGNLYSLGVLINQQKS